MRLVFVGTPAAAVPTLRALVASDDDVVAVVTRKDAPVGRRRILTPSPVALAAEELGLPVIRADRLDDVVTERIHALAPDLGVIVAYGALVRARLLAVPRLGWINLHFSLLPRWRGAAPVQRAVIAGDSRIGASVFQLVAELDAGDVYAEILEEVRERTAGELLEVLSERGASLTRQVVKDLASGRAVATAQTGDVSYAPKLDVTDGRIDWMQPTDRILALVRGVTPEPGASTMAGELRLKVLALRSVEGRLDPGQVQIEGGRALVGTGDGAVDLVTVQPSGKKPMSGAAWARGLRSRTVLA
ncbi:methionyl-tRNA formyltransferase [Rathayibacter toxicus]|uniref:Methionyl-tRNA formyltransferase n=1 Tax=Rathayibacter toxicus TaxID=145458 RepID=A0A0C5BEN3_9MICO|nr:methionyl-tRNA formyltransferase [Rathayibacter toxicus]AJM77766.1 methionyl-tRNA formyltransferase [Rathayibacter toxicus]ALS58065.1 methionyl-tRNA formyltransferase [Rathayibacter toxicus]KKM45278.1 methionyl-tRNA formyltransferase [Rathayibacter toxicus]PPG21902.1 methionyl-tRNA formyltransferase [Rathayibacter toxicus]PPG46864.1 methionyl-tRNA formyltransferase [Rathayibacter toxicus]